MTSRPKTPSEGVSARLAALTDRLGAVMEEVQKLGAEIGEIQQSLSSGVREAEVGEGAESVSEGEASRREGSSGTGFPYAVVEGGEGDALTEEAGEAEVGEEGELEAQLVAREEDATETESGAVEAVEELAGEGSGPEDLAVGDLDPDEGPEGSGQEALPVAAMDLETRIGAVWLNRVGLLALVIAIALMGRLVLPVLQPWHRVALGFLGAGALFGVGRWFEGKIQQVARPVMAGGLAAGFFTSFAAHFLPAMACLNLGFSLVLMSLFVGAILVLAERWRSQSIAGLAIVLGHVAAYVASVNTDTLSMVAVAFLSATAVALLTRHNWFQLTLVAVIAAFSSHFLWAIWDTDLASRPDRFALNLVFLTSYYGIFLIADGIFFRRLQGGGDQLTQPERVCGRNQGPTAMVLYACLVAALFHTTAVHWPRIYLFFFPMAALQLAILLYHRRRGSSDSPLYLTAATTFATLGLFSMLGGLALNMALAAQALLLLVLGRTINFWFLRPLAQGVLAVNFAHFWFSSARHLDSWPTFLGAVLMASVYFVKSHLNETWQPIPDEQRMSPKTNMGLWRRFYLRISVPVAHAQTLAGAVLMAYQCDKFLGPPWNGAALAFLAALATAAGLYLGSAPVLQGAGLLQVAVAFLLWRQAVSLPQTTLDPRTWEVNQGVAFVLAIAACGGLWMARRRGRRTFLRFASLGLAAAAVAGFAATVAGSSPLDLGQEQFSLVALLAPFALWLGAESWPTPKVPLLELSNQQRRFYGAARWRRSLLALLAATLGVWGSFHATGSSVTALMVLSGITLVLAASSFLRGSPYLLMGLLVHQGLLCGLSVWFLQARVPEHALVRWWVLTETVGIAVLLLAACPRWKRGSYALGGLMSLALALSLFLCLTLIPEQVFAPIALWAVPSLGLFLAIEIFRGSPARCTLTLPVWPDRRGEKIFLYYSRAVCGVAAILSSTAVGLMLERAFPEHGRVLWVSMGVAVVLMAATLWRNSPYLMTGLLTLLGLMTAHRVFYGEDLSTQPILEWASVSVLSLCALLLLWAAPRFRRSSFGWGGVLSLTLGLVALAEFLFNLRKGPSLSWLWLIPLAATWWGAEELWRGFSSVDPSVRWRDRVDLEDLVRRARPLAVGLSSAAAGLLILLTWRQFPAPVGMIYVTIFYAVLFVALTAVLKSPPMAAVFAVCLTAAHPLFYLRIGPASAAGVSPMLAILLLVVTMAAGVATEWIFRHHEGPGRQRPAWWGAWYPYVLGFLLGGLFLGPYGEYLFGRPAFSAPMQIALAVVAFALARVLGLRWWVRAALGYSIIVLSLWLSLAWLHPAYRVGLAAAAAVVFLELVVMERILAGNPMKLSRASPFLVELQRRTLVTAAAVVMVSALYLSREVQGSWTTAGWSLLALILMLAGFWWKAQSYRRIALGVFSLSLVRLVAFDIRRLETLQIMIALASLGACLVAVSFLYGRYKEEIRRWL